MLPSDINAASPNSLCERWNGGRLAVTSFQAQHRFQFGRVLAQHLHHGVSIVGSGSNESQENILRDKF